MERWSAGRAPSRRCGYDHPSFSSTLLDAIYRSIDDESEHDGAGPVRSEDHRHSIPAPQPHPGPGKRSASAVQERRTPTATSGEHRPANRRRPIISTSSSSDNSSYGGFSSSEPESTTPHPALKLRPIRTGASAAAAAPARSSAHPRGTSSALPPRSLRVPSEAAASAPVQQEEKKKSSSIRSKLRDLRKSGTPASPGARLAGFLNSIFAAAAGNPRKHKTNSSSSSSPAVLYGGVGEESACSTASSYSRSCLSKTPSSRGRTASQPSEAGAKRSVRFYPVSVIVGEDLRPCGQKSMYEGGGGGDRVWANASATTTTTTAEIRAAAETKKRVEELLRGCSEEEEEEEEGSDASSDLFELENLTAVGRGTGYRDELPVYETTTYLTSNRPISHTLII